LSADRAPQLKASVRLLLTPGHLVPNYSMFRFFSPRLSFYLDWYWWALMLVILISVYVQGVGFNLEARSGVPRHRFGKMYAYPAAIRPVCWLAMLLLSGWVSVIVSIIAMFVGSFVMAGFTREHARLIIEQNPDGD
jgi:hypothetical protein